MTQEQLKNLRLEDFQAPNKVLCYGAGLIGRMVVDSYRRLGIHIVGFIDKYKQGTVKTEFGALPIYSIDTAVHTFGKELKVVITISNTKDFPEIVSSLTAAGVEKSCVVDWSFINWVTVPSAKCYCESLFGTTQLGSGSFIQCCYWGENRSFNVETLEPGTPPEQIAQNYVEKLRHYHKKALEGEVPAYCVGCPHLEDRPVEKEIRLKNVYFSATAHCNAECIYCSGVLETDLKKLPYDAKGYGKLFFSTLRYLDDCGLLAPDVRIGYAGGEISVSPARKELLDFALKHPQYQHKFLSNCIVYNEGIAQALAQNPKSELMCDLDAGTPESYLLMKGFNFFDKVVENLGRYAQNGRVILKYIVMPGFNTTREDYLGMIKLLKKLGLTELLLSQDHLHTMDLYTERRSIFEVARFKKLLAENGIEGVLFPDSFSIRQARLVERFYKQMP